jgi:hypothetical protein
VLPDLQERGIARALLARTMEQFDTWGTRQVGLFTFAQSPKHIALYQKHGFYARFLTALMAAPARRAQTKNGWSRFGALTKPQQEEALHSCREVAESIYPGLDLTAEIRTTHAQDLGDTVLVEGAGGLAAFAGVNTAQKAKPAPIYASSNSARSVTDRRLSGTSFG